MRPCPRQGQDKRTYMEKNNSDHNEDNIDPHLMMKAAATFLTLGHLRSATTVSKLPNRPITMMKPVMTAAKVRRPGENLK